MKIKTFFTKINIYHFVINNEDLFGKKGQNVVFEFVYCNEDKIRCQTQGKISSIQIDEQISDTITIIGVEPYCLIDQNTQIYGFVCNYESDFNKDIAEPVNKVVVALTKEITHFTGISKKPASRKLPLIGILSII